MLDKKYSELTVGGNGTVDSQLARCIAPAENASCLPPICYSNEAFRERETAAIFGRKWIGIGHAGRFGQSGDYETMTIADVPLIVLRDKKGVLRAFANSCRHRGARLLEGEGNCGGIKCPFHCWSYKLDGTLVGVPHSEDIEDFDKSKYGLLEFKAAESSGLAFVCLDPEAPSLEDQLGDFSETHSPWPMDTLVPTRRRSFEVNCNWKAFLDVFNEYYHLPFVHPETVNSLYNRPEPGDDVSGEYATQYGGTEGTGGLLEGQQDHALPTMPDLNPAVANGVRYTWVFPNMAFAAGRDAVWLYEATPINARRCHVTMTACFPRDVAAKPEFKDKVAHYYERLDAAIAEDIPALENQQFGLNSPFAMQGRVHPLLESNVAGFARWYARQLI
jgi:phenylpropionate dioxygenase-like ring-hydroxylating dioxygenase large terminal subunit